MGQVMEVVIVDDKSMITDLIESYIKLSYDNIIIHSYNDPSLALDFIKANKDHIDVIITDYIMPLVNGIELLNATLPNTVRIMISGYVSDIAEEKLAELNAHFFEKPVPMRKIGQLIEKKLYQP